MIPHDVVVAQRPGVCERAGLLDAETLVACCHPISRTDEEVRKPKRVVGSLDIV